VCFWGFIQSNSDGALLAQIRHRQLTLMPGKMLISRLSARQVWREPSGPSLGDRSKLVRGVAIARNGAACAIVVPGGVDECAAGDPDAMCRGAPKLSSHCCRVGLRGRSPQGSVPLAAHRAHRAVCSSSPCLLAASSFSCCCFPAGARFAWITMQRFLYHWTTALWSG
jgi:hypothetical protein